MKKLIQKLNTSLYFDIFGIFLVVLSAYLGHYLFSHLDAKQWGPLLALLPFGLISTASSSLSLIATRLTGRLSKWGNIISVINVVIAGLIDYALGNKGAVLTYPITFILSAWAVKSWQTYAEGKANKLSLNKLIILLIAFVIVSAHISFWLNYFAFGKQISALMLLTSLVFALSLIANLLNVLKLSEQWWFWLVYNVVQLLKALVQGNLANLGKYIYYIINAIVAKIVWNTNEDSKQ